MNFEPEWLTMRIIRAEASTGDPIPVRVGLVHTAGRVLTALQVGDGPMVIMPGQKPGELIAHLRDVVGLLYRSVTP